MFLLCVALVVALVALVLSEVLRRRRMRLPPGPWGLPVLGYLPWIDPKAPHETLTRLVRKYGPICGLRMGSVYTVLLADPRLVRQVLAKDAFSGRAPLYLTHGIMQGYGLICAEGELWREQRRFVASCLKNLGAVRIGARRDRIERRIVVAVDESIEKLRERSARANGADPLDTLHHCVGNLMNSLVFGKVYAEEDALWKWLREIQEEGVKHIGVAGPLNFLPFLRFLPRYGATMTELVEGKLKSHEVYERLIQEYRRSRSEANGRPEPESVLAAFCEEVARREERGGDLGHFTKRQHHHLLADLFGAGTDTTLTTLRWFLLLVAIHPRVQERIRDEMESALRGRQPTLADRTVLPYLEAAIAETQRLRSVVPVGIPHGTLEDTRIGDYDVPKGTMVVPLQWALHTDPSHWTEPLVYRPERFIAEDGSLARPEWFLPFQCGKRMCVGDELARMVLFSFAARILRACDVSLAPGERVDLDGDCGITLTPKPHRLIFAARA